MIVVFPIRASSIVRLPSTAPAPSLRPQDHPKLPVVIHQAFGTICYSTRTSKGPPNICLSQAAREEPWQTKRPVPLLLVQGTVILFLIYTPTIGRNRLLNLSIFQASSSKSSTPQDGLLSYWHIHHSSPVKTLSQSSGSQYSKTRKRQWRKWRIISLAFD